MLQKLSLECGTKSNQMGAFLANAVTYYLIRNCQQPWHCDVDAGIRPKMCVFRCVNLPPGPELFDEESNVMWLRPSVPACIFDSGHRDSRDTGPVCCGGHVETPPHTQWHWSSVTAKIANTHTHALWQIVYPSLLYNMMSNLNAQCLGDCPGKDSVHAPQEE